MKARIFFFLLIITISAHCRDHVWQADSILKFCLEHPQDTIALSDFNSQIAKLYSSNTDTAIFFSIKQLEIAQKAQNKNLESRALNAWGICMEYKGQPDSAIVIYKLALNVALQTTDQRLMADTYNNLGIVYSLKGLYELSLEYTLRALEIHEIRQDTNGMAIMYNNIGLRYSELDNQKKAIEYYRQAIKLNNYLKNEWRLGTNRANLGRSYFLQEKFDSATVHYKYAIKLGKETENTLNTEISYYGLAFVYFKSEEIELSQAYADSSIAMALKIDDEIGIHNYDLLNGFILNKRGQHTKALKHLLAFQDWNERANLSGRNFEMYHELSNTYKSLNDYPRALSFMEKFAFIRDTIYRNQKDLALGQINIYKLGKEEKEKELLNREIELQEIQIAQQKSLRNTFIIIGILLLLIAIGTANRFLTERKTKRALADKNIAIKAERDRSEKLLLNILPEQVAEELKINGESEAKDFDEVTVLFTDFEEFTSQAERLSAHDLVHELNICFKGFDQIITTYKLEKIKTIGDAYMAASGLHLPRNTGAKEAVLAALKMQDFMKNRNAELNSVNQSSFKMRAGIHTGPVVAGIVGVKKFQFDIWGDTVNTASRMESSGKIGKVNISQATYNLIKDDSEFAFEERGKVVVKGKGELPMWYVSLA